VAIVVCLTAAYVIGQEFFLAMLTIMGTSIGLIVMAVGTINFVAFNLGRLKSCTNTARLGVGSRNSASVEAVAPFHRWSQASDAAHQIDIVVATAETIDLSDRNSSIMFLGPTVNDGDVDRLCSLGELKWLVLDNTDITDAGLMLLANLRKLRRLYVRHTRVTQEGIQRLQDRLPDLTILS